MVSIISRLLENIIIESLKPGLVIGLFGARRTGKTFLMEQIKGRIKGKNILMVQGDNTNLTSK